MKTFLALLLALVAPLVADAQFLNVSNPPGSITLEWNASASPAVVSYNLYWGVAAGQYTNRVSVVGTNVTITPLVRGTSYHFACTAVDTNHLESAFSNDVIGVPPAGPIPPVLHIALLAGGGISIQGSGDADAVYTIEASQDLVSWVELGTTVSDSAGTFWFFDHDPPEIIFYRALI